MQIPSTNGMATHMNSVKQLQLQNQTDASERFDETAGRFDKVNISPGRSTESRFQMELKSKLSQEVRTATTTSRLNELREKVLSGEYKPDPAAIARKMLMLEGAPDIG